MAGNHSVQEFLDRLCNKSSAQISDLSSAQKSRLFSWAVENGVDLTDWAPGEKLAEKGVQEDLAVNSSGPLWQEIGIDIQHISELDVPEGDWKTSAELARLFTAEEIAYCESRRNPLESLAAVFAAKEAIFKASQALTKDGFFVEIGHDDLGRPIADFFDLSVSHSNGYAVAVALGRSAKCRSHASSDEINSISDSTGGGDNALEHFPPKRYRILKGLLHYMAPLVSGAIGGSLIMYFITYM